MRGLVVCTLILSSSHAACGSPESDPPAHAPDAPASISPAGAETQAPAMSSASATTPAKTEAELIERVLAALAAKDWQQLEPLFWSEAAADAACQKPESEQLKLKTELAELYADAAFEFTRCVRVDWADARILETRSTGEGKPLEGCDAARQRDLRVQVQVGGAQHQLRINDPVKAGDTLVLTKGPRCPDVLDLRCGQYFDHASRLIVAEAGEDARKVFTGLADPRAQFDLACQTTLSMKRQGERASAHLDCVLKGATWADVEACGKSPIPLPRMQPKGMDVPFTPEEEATLGPECMGYFHAGMACAKEMGGALEASFEAHLAKLRGTLKEKPLAVITKACAQARELAVKARSKDCPNTKWN